MRNVILILCFTVLTQFAFSQEKGTFKDTRDGRVYQTIKIGNQIWLAENFAYKSNSYKFMEQNSDTSFVNNYGRLYDWKTAKEIVPDGWHIPSKAEWEILHKKLGGSGPLVYEKIKKGGSSGFNAILCGYCDNGEGYNGFEQSVNFWTSTPTGSRGAYWFRVSSENSNPKNTGLDWTDYNLSYGYSLRLIKNK